MPPDVLNIFWTPINIRRRLDSIICSNCVQPLEKQLRSNRAFCDGIFHSEVMIIIIHFACCTWILNSLSSQTYKKMCELAQLHFLPLKDRHKNGSSAHNYHKNALEFPDLALCQTIDIRQFFVYFWLIWGKRVQTSYVEGWWRRNWLTYKYKAYT